MIETDNWDDYRYFLITVEEGSFAAAARKLNVSQPTVSRRVTHLEERLGISLFERLPDGQRLSTEGHTIREAVGALHEKSLEARRIALGLQTNFGGTVKIAVTRGLAEKYLPPHLASLYVVNPEISVELIIGNSAVDVRELEADVAIRFGTLGGDDLIGRKLGVATCGIYGSTAYFDKHGRPASLAELANHQIIGSAGHIAGFVQNRELAKAVGQGSSRSPFSTDDVNVQIALAKRGLGLISVPRYMAPVGEGMEELDLVDFTVELDLWLLTHRDLRKSKRVRMVLDHLFACFKHDAHLFGVNQTVHQILADE